MKKIWIVMLCVVFILGVGNSAKAMHELISKEEKMVEPGADAAKLYTFINMPKPYYEKLSLWSEREKLRAGNEFHGSFVSTYVNDIALNSLKNKEKMAYGSCIVVENYIDQKKIETLAVMYRVKDYNPDGDGWFWAKYDATNGYVLDAGKGEKCMTCHSAKSGSDYLLP